MGKGMVIGNRNDWNSYNGNNEWEQGIGMGTGNGKRGTGKKELGTGNGERGTGNGKRGTGKLKDLYFLLTTMTEACDKMHFTLLRRRSKTGCKLTLI